ncbi:hypothetical protein BD626DRAFT_548630 [Schizophyllum amplum]|uniref:CFA20 domain-containing protein n=1 Tax=Schizophyllum amplum TaxID=97359 RepID=A0A550CBS3_9AGAR|nr:hypothetical protein BD626DRAFT_548630 [Auriculariopsis ampla]
MFSGSVQPNTVSLFSSTGSLPLQLFSTQTDATLPEDSFIHLLNDTTNLPAPPPPASLTPIHTGKEGMKDTKTLIQTVLHIQSPTLPTTFIQCPPQYPFTSASRGLGLKHPWAHIQVRDLGREWSCEFGIADQSGRTGIVRLSTFQKQPRLDAVGDLPLLHLPLSFPQRTDEYSATTWSAVDLHLPRILSAFTSPEFVSEDQPPPPHIRLPAGSFSHVVYVRIYATCRLRRIWFSHAGPSQKIPWEFDLYGCDPARAD